MCFSSFAADPSSLRLCKETRLEVLRLTCFQYTGHYEPVEEISKILDAYEKETGVDIPIHVDAASGGFIAPFTHAKAGGPKW